MVSDDVQRLESERLRPPPERDPIGELLREVISLLAGAFRDAGELP